VLVGVGVILGHRSRDFSEEKSLLIVVVSGGAWKLCLDQWEKVGLVERKKATFGDGGGGYKLIAWLYWFKIIRYHTKNAPN